MNKASLRSLILARIRCDYCCTFTIYNSIGDCPLNWTNICHRLNRYRFGQANGDLRYFNLLLIRLIGLPVYAGMSSGFGVLFGPTGGYLIGFYL